MKKIFFTFAVAILAFAPIHKVQASNILAFSQANPLEMKRGGQGKHKGWAKGNRGKHKGWGRGRGNFGR